MKWLPQGMDFHGIVGLAITLRRSVRAKISDLNMWHSKSAGHANWR